jgi:L-alanine-DL-glutamate epimerase-like enolase superfamily enzyme
MERAMRIVAVDLRTAPMANNWLTDRVIANPMSQYPEYQPSRSLWYREMSAGLVEITVEDGTRGHGFVGGGKAAAAAVVLDEQVRDLVVGKDCFQTELISEQLYRATVMYGIGGIAADLMSGIDIALWDLKGKLLQRPVYDLLGGRTRDHLRPYLTSWDAKALDEFGIRDVKVAMPFGPAAGEEGMRENEKVVAAARESVGSDGFIALDCYMAWNVPYAVEMARRLRDLRIAWIEEPVMPEDIDGYRRIRDSVECMVTGGEHTYTLEGFRRLIEEGGVDIVQPDIYRTGGPTVLKKVAALAKAFGRQLICHGVGMATYHFLISNGPEVSPRCEYLDIQAGSTTGWVLTGEPRPRDGRLELPDVPGFGYEVNEAAFAPGARVSPIW